MLLTINNIHKVDIDTIPIDETWTMGEEKTSTMHSIHAYPAKFPPFITTKALQYANQQGIEVHTVADIFCGCGTVAYEALANRKSFFGCDLNPVATLIARTKCRKYDSNEIKKYFTRIKALFFSDDLDVDEYFCKNSRICYWFYPKQLNDLYKLRSSIISVVETEKYLDFFLCAFSSILKSCSKWLTKSIKPQIDPQKQAKDVWEEFCKQILKMERANETSEVVEENNAEILTQSVLELNITEPFVDLLVTSPPYVTSYEYADIHQLSTLWLDYSPDYKHFRTGSIGSLYHSCDLRFNVPKLNQSGLTVVMQMYSVDKKQAKAIAQYYVNMQEVVKKICNIVKKGGACLFVIGNTEYKNVKIDNARHLAESLLNEGFYNVTIKRRKILNKILTPYRDKNGKFSSDKTSRKIYSEEFLIFAQL